jgi:hypothetical protein
LKRPEIDGRDQRVAGLPFFLNFTGITSVTLIGHVLYAVVLDDVFAAGGAATTHHSTSSP